MYGFAILCCPDFRKAMAFAELYHALAAPLATIEFTEEEGFASWIIEPNARAATDPQIYRFITEMQIGIHISLMRDIMGPAFNPDQISLAYPKPHDFGLPVGQIGCPLSFASRTNQIMFRSAWLDQAASLGNKTTYPAVVALCDELLNDLKIANWSSRRDSCTSASEYHRPSDPRAIAKLLEVSDRSLRRQLREQGISFRGLLDELRMQIALKIPAHDKARKRGYCAGAWIQRRHKFPPRISPLDQQVTQRDQNEIASSAPNGGLLRGWDNLAEMGPRTSLAFGTPCSKRLGRLTHMSARRS